MTYICSLLATLSLICCATAETMCGSTLEWLADSCPYVGVYVAQSFKPSANAEVKIEGRLSNTMRGQLPNSLSFEYPAMTQKPVDADAITAVGNRFLVFLRVAEMSQGKKEIRVEHVICLSHPATKGYLYVALRPDFTVLTDGAQILQIVQKRIEDKPATPFAWEECPQDRWRLRIPIHSPADGAINCRSACYLWVPDDLLDEAMKHQRRWQEAEAGADQPATMPAGKVSVKGKPSTPTSKDLPR